MKNNYQVLKYPGSKWRIAGEIAKMLPEHHSYLEPFFGSGAVLFSKEPSHIETVNDLDGNVTNLFSCIREDPEKIARLIALTPYAREEYERAFEETDKEKDPYKKAVDFMTTCWMGHGFRTNGYRVGWKNDVVGRERAYALRNWCQLPENIVYTAERLKMVQIENRPALEVIQRFHYPNVCMYVDPPYLLRTRTGKQYRHEMRDEDHMELLEVLKCSPAKILVSGYPSKLYDEMLAGWNKVWMRSNAEYGNQRTEVIWCNFDTSTASGQLTLPI